MKNIFLKLTFNILKIYIIFTMIYLFCVKQGKIRKIEKLAANLHDGNQYVIQIRNLKQALNYGLVLEKANRVIKFNQNAQLKPYIDMNNDLKKMTLRKTFSS